MRLLALSAPILAIIALAVIVAVPTAVVETTDEAGTTERDTWSWSDVADDEGHPVSATFLLVAGIIAVVGTMAFWIGDVTAKRRAGPWLVGLGGITAAVGLGMSLYGNLLWAGRIVPTLFHLVLGTDGPSPELIDAGYSTRDMPSAIYPVAPVIAALAAGANVWFLLRAWSAHVPEVRDLRVMARRHAKWGMAIVAALAAAAFVPWNVMELDDNTSPAEGQAQDTDIFVLSAYDVLRGRQDSYTVAEETGENALIHFEWLARLLTPLFVGLIIALALSAVAVSGTQLAGRGEAVWGRLMENVAFASLGALAYAMVLGILGAFVFVDASDLFEGTLTGGPLVLTAVAGGALVPAVRVVRELVREDSDLVADDFPEPIIYD